MRKSQIAALNELTFAKRVVIMTLDRPDVLMTCGEDEALKDFDDLEHLDERMEIALGEMPAANAEVLRKRFGGETIQTQVAVALELGRSNRRVQQREQAAYWQLRRSRIMQYLKTGACKIAGDEADPQYYLYTMHELTRRQRNVLVRHSLIAKSELERFCAGGVKSTRAKLLRLMGSGPVTADNIIRVFKKYDLLDD